MATASTGKRRAISYDDVISKKRKIEDKKEEEEEKELCPLLKAIHMLPALCKEKIPFHWMSSNLQTLETYDDVSTITFILFILFSLS